MIFVRNSRFFYDFCTKFQVLFKISQIPGFCCLNCQIPGYSRFPGFLATLLYGYKVNDCYPKCLFFKFKGVQDYSKKYHIQGFFSIIISCSIIFKNTRNGLFIIFLGWIILHEIHKPLFSTKNLMQFVTWFFKIPNPLNH